MRITTIAVTILLSSIGWAQSASMPAKVIQSKSMPTGTASPMQKSNSSTYSYEFANPDSAPSLGGRWVRSEQISANQNGIVFAKFSFAQPGSAPIIAAVRQQFGAPKLAGKGAVWSAEGNVITVSDSEDFPVMTISNSKYLARE